MVLRKEERNREFLRCWKKLGMGNRALAEKFGLTVVGVRSLKYRLRHWDPSLYAVEPPKPPRARPAWSVEKVKRNEEFVKCWKRGMTNEELARKFGMTVGGVQALKQRMRVKHPEVRGMRAPKRKKTKRGKPDEPK